MEAKRSSAILARDHIKPHPDAPDCEVTWSKLSTCSNLIIQQNTSHVNDMCFDRAEALTLYLVWDSESEVSTDCTLLDTRYDARDGSSGSSEVKRKHRKHKKKRARSTSSTSESEESVSAKDWCYIFDCKLENF